MNVKKSGSSRTPGYPSKRQFLAALGIGALAATSPAEPPRLGGVPAGPKVQPPELVRLRGDIAVEPVKTNAIPCVPAPAVTNAVSYTVQKGDTLTGIAKAKLGDANRWKEIQALNPALVPDALVVGTLIILPAAALVETPRFPGEIMAAPRILGKPAPPK